LPGRHVRRDSARRPCFGWPAPDAGDGTSCPLAMRPVSPVDGPPPVSTPESGSSDWRCRQFVHLKSGNARLLVRPRERCMALRRLGIGPECDRRDEVPEIPLIRTGEVMAIQAGRIRRARCSWKPAKTRLASCRCGWQRPNHDQPYCPPVDVEPAASPGRMVSGSPPTWRNELPWMLKRVPVAEPLKEFPENEISESW